MYTILVKNDNSLQPSITDTKIIQGSKNIDYLRFLINPTYNDIDISELSVIRYLSLRFTITNRVSVQAPLPVKISRVLVL